MCPPSLRRLVPAVVALASGGLPASASAQAGGGAAPMPPATQALYEEAMRALDAKDYATACPRLEDVVKLVPQGVGARLQLAECYEDAGKLASASATYKLAATLAAQAKQPRRQQLAQDRADALEPRLATLMIVVGEGVRSLAGVEITCDGAPVMPSQWGVAVPIDKGRHVITATAARKAPWQRVIEVSADGVIDTLLLDTMADANTVTPRPLSAPKGAAGGQVPPATLAPKRPAAPTLPSYMIGGLGVVTLSIGAAFGAQAISNNSKAEDLCSANGCPDRAKAVDTLERAQTQARLATAGIGLGLAGVAAGSYLLFWAPTKKPHAAPGSALGLSLTPGGAALGLGGRF
jgi:tetratricopeptide (TPR) repeat protein